MIVWDSRMKETGNLAWVKQGNVNTETILDVLEDLKKRYEHGKSHFILVWDGLPPHRSKATRDMIAVNKSWLTVVRFPAYSPELNPKENLWDEIREKIFKNYALKSINAVRAKLKQAIVYIERNPETVKSITSFPYIAKSL